MGSSIFRGFSAENLESGRSKVAVGLAVHGFREVQDCGFKLRFVKSRGFARFGLEVGSLPGSRSRAFQQDVLGLTL